MKTVLVRYVTHHAKASENEAMIHGVFAELRERRPGGFRYAAFKLADGVSFVHVATFDAPDAGNPLLALDSFKRFQQNLGERCVESPAATELFAVDEYGFSSLALGTVSPAHS